MKINNKIKNLTIIQYKDKMLEYKIINLYIKIKINKIYWIAKFNWLKSNKTLRYQNSLYWISTVFILIGHGIINLLESSINIHRICVWITIMTSIRKYYQNIIKVIESKEKRKNIS